MMSYQEKKFVLVVIQKEYIKETLLLFNIFRIQKEAIL